MSNGDTQNNCVMEVCCGNEDGKQIRALAHDLHEHVPGINLPDARNVAEYLCGKFDFAPKGSLYAFKQEIARLAKTETYHDES